jgi:large subunit ribosomal protein L35
MPKMKTKSAAAKRFKVTGSGKVKYQHAYKRHKSLAKSPTQRRRLEKTGILGKIDTERMHELLPYKF